jgi:hypothetical protein
MTFCLGRLPHSPERLARGLMSAPAPMLYRYQLDRSAIDYQPGLWGNGTIPDCTAVGVANAALASGLLRSATPVITDGKPQALYADVIGMPGASDAQLAATDGAMAMDMLNDVATHGFDAGQQVPLVPIPRTVPNSREAIAGLMCNRLLGVAYLGIRLYQGDMDTFGQGPWVAPIAASGALVGGHVLLAWDYPVGLADADLTRLATWAALQPASWAWIMERLDETHGLEWPQLKAAA